MEKLIAADDYSSLKASLSSWLWRLKAKRGLRVSFIREISWVTSLAMCIVCAAAFRDSLWKSGWSRLT